MNSGNSQPAVSSTESVRPMASLTAGLLLLLGLMYQLGVFGGSSSGDHFWLFYTLAKSAWTLIGLTGVAGFSAFFHFWPILTVGVGLAFATCACLGEFHDR
jgi:hypothetical protein